MEYASAPAEKGGGASRALAVLPLVLVLAGSAIVLSVASIVVGSV
jgi:hypothetical protein